VRVTPAERRPVALAHISCLVALCGGLYLYGITWGLPNVDDWTNLSLAPLKPLAFAKRLLSHEPWLYHYPPLHFIVLSVVYAPYVAYLVLAGGMGVPSETYPFGLAQPEASLTVFILLARLTSVAMATGLVVVNYLTVRRLYGAAAAFVSSFLIATAYPIVHFAHNANVDVPYLFWLSLALYSAVRLMETFDTRWYVLLGLFGALAIGTKHTAYAVLAGLAPTLLYLQYRRRVERAGQRVPPWRLVDGRMVAAAGVFVAALVVMFNPITNWDGFVAHVARHRFASIGGNWTLRTAASAVDGHLQLATAYAGYLAQAGGLAVFALLVAGGLYCAVRAPRTFAIATLPVAAYYLLFLQNFGTHHLRYVLPVFVLLTWHAGRLAADATRATTRWRPLARLGLALVLAHALVHGFTVDYLYARDPRYAAERWMAIHVAPGSTVLGLEPRYSLPRLPKDVHATYRRLWNFNGVLVADITDVPATWVVAGMSLPRRTGTKGWGVDFILPVDVDAVLRERGYEAVASFETELPFWAVDVPDLHTINPRVVIWRRVTPSAGGSA
jgi:4-amino-4-deoxy-L-arabinose transferase-like glycosyltransferase